MSAISKSEAIDCLGQSEDAIGEAIYRLRYIKLRLPLESDAKRMVEKALVELEAAKPNYFYLKAFIDQHGFGEKGGAK